MASNLAIPLATQDFANPQTKLRICKAIEAAIARSFKQFPMRHVTQAEIHNRFYICFETYKQLRNELKWSKVRAIDHMDQILTASLLGGRFEPNRRTSWYGPGVL